MDAHEEIKLFADESNVAWGRKELEEIEKEKKDKRSMRSSKKSVPAKETSEKVKEKMKNAESDSKSKFDCIVPGCVLSREHGLTVCYKFNSRMLDEKERFLRERNLCLRCLEHTRDKPCSASKGCPVPGCMENHHHILHPSFLLSVQGRVMARCGRFPQPAVCTGWPVSYESIPEFESVPPLFKGKVLEVPSGMEPSIYLLFYPDAKRMLMEKSEAEVKLSSKVSVCVRGKKTEASEEVVVTLVGPEMKSGACLPTHIRAMLVNDVSERIRVPEIQGHQENFPALGRERVMVNKLIAASSGTPRLIIGRDHQDVWPQLVEQFTGVKDRLFIVTIPMNPYLMILGHMSCSDENYKIPKKRKAITPKILLESLKIKVTICLL